MVGLSIDDSAAQEAGRAAREVAHAPLSAGFRREKRSRAEIYRSRRRHPPRVARAWSPATERVRFQNPSTGCCDGSALSCSILMPQVRSYGDRRGLIREHTINLAHNLLKDTSGLFEQFAAHRLVMMFETVNQRQQAADRRWLSEDDHRPSHRSRCAPLLAGHVCQLECPLSRRGDRAGREQDSTIPRQSDLASNRRAEPLHD